MLRAIPELQTALGKFDGGLGGADGEKKPHGCVEGLVQESCTDDRFFPPFRLLDILRQVAPQFAEMTRDGHGYAQQDAEEVWVRIIQALQNSLHGLSSSDTTDQAALDSSRKFVEQYLTGHMVIKRSTAEAPDEAPSFSKDPSQSCSATSPPPPTR